jgi:hypothetical protein
MQILRQLSAQEVDPPAVGIIRQSSGRLVQSVAAASDSCNAWRGGDGGAGFFMASVLHAAAPRRQQGFTVLFLQSAAANY